MEYDRSLLKHVRNAMRRRANARFFQESRTRTMNGRRDEIDAKMTDVFTRRYNRNQGDVSNEVNGQPTSECIRNAGKSYGNVLH
ncbi:uncharacterized protein FOMMEDRAFT_18860 [Fomitiporia mediterranea MF3/22]|uniref:uncharacterized protein n=1 Tax=Fomitiporia mediterranea (strain MF3/22) TaxID=694068 RepID=UPI00044079F0|nr:uncharacterized protein FOMMEDRAFT_18860 [Fomitiporia mediterranea MF3/22]EJD05254.1 hypothetical protein FOMMEDRAFT_18860 [Fomitiporia mediterranea MF3/22]